jgi:hypothetical protein
MELEEADKGNETFNKGQDKLPIKTNQSERGGRLMD